MNRILKITLIMFVGFSLSSCEEYLNETLISDVSAGSYYTTAQGFEDAVKATYSEMKPFFGPERGFTMTTFGTDVHTNGADGSHKPINLYDGGLNPAQSFIRDTWRDFYRGINQANAVINRSTDLDIDPELKAARIAEVRFLRAFYYFLLTQFYGDIHLSLEETEGVEIEANKTSAAEIYSQAIIPDLEAAIAALPDEQGDYGRATKPAAEFLLGKVYLTRGYRTFGSAADFAEAERLFTSVINNYGFELANTVADLIDQDNQLNSEVIFTVQNSVTQTNEGLDGNGNRGHLYFLMEYDVLPGMARDTENGRPWKRFRPTPFHLSLWNRDIDSRYDLTYKHAFLSNNAGNIPNWSQEEADAGYLPAGAAVGDPKFTVGDTALFIPGPGRDADWPQERQAATRYLVITKDEYDERWFPPLAKFLDPRRPNRQHTQGSRDFVLMRLADAYLCRAEARLQQNKLDEAVADVNVIRTRAAWPGQEAAMMISAADLDIDYLLDERARELDGEMHRWFDLARVRTSDSEDTQQVESKLYERTRLHNPQAAPNIQKWHVVRPIPLDQIDRTLGGYPQNPGYPQ
jgi:hypothetical protein